MSLFSVVDISQVLQKGYLLAAHLFILNRYLNNPMMVHLKGLIDE